MPDNFYDEVLIDHNLHPQHLHGLPGATCSHAGMNPSCGDEITLELQVEDGMVKDAAFTGIGCAISQASTDIMAELIRGRSVEEARGLAQKFISMIKGEITDEEELEELDEALALKNVSHMPARVKCAVLAWHTLDDALKSGNNNKQ